MEGESHNLQNDFFNAARKSKSPVTVFLGTGKKLTGKIKSFDKFTLLLETYQGDLMVFKHAISTVSNVTRVGVPAFLRASGFLYGLVSGLDIAVAGRLGSACGYEVCQVLGAQIPSVGWERVRTHLGLADA